MISITPTTIQIIPELLRPVAISGTFTPSVEIFDVSPGAAMDVSVVVFDWAKVLEEIRIQNDINPAANMANVFFILNIYFVDVIVQDAHADQYGCKPKSKTKISENRRVKNHAHGIIQIIHAKGRIASIARMQTIS